LFSEEYAGFIGVIAMLIISLHSKLHALFALLALITGSASVAIADVTIDACVAENSINYPHLAADMMTLTGFCASVGGLIGFSISGLLVHAIGSKVSITSSYSLCHFFSFRSKLSEFFVSLEF
jgi:hypothetical protein